MHGRSSSFLPRSQELSGLKGKIAATGYALPDIGRVDADDEGEEA
jgi:hypothetical protein